MFVRFVNLTLKGTEMRTVRQLQPPTALLPRPTPFRPIIQRDDRPLRLLVHEHCVPLAERPAPNILPGDAHVVALAEEGAEGHCLEDVGQVWARI